jgi:pyruvate kinase
LEGGKAVELKVGELLELSMLCVIIFKLATDYTFKGNSQKVACSYPHLMTSVKVGGKILIADGEIVAVVAEILEVSYNQ